jgi:hypothetical protein
MKLDDVAQEMVDHRTFDGRIQLLEYRPACSSNRPLEPTASSPESAEHLVVGTCEVVVCADVE